MVLPTEQISFSDLRRVIGPNDANSISLGHYRPNNPLAYGNGIVGVTNTDIKLSQFRGKTKLAKGFTFRAFQGSAYTFSAGAGGACTNSTYLGGGGGGGGILVNGGGGGGGTSGNVLGGFAGGGGAGYGAGGGGGTWYAIRGVFQFGTGGGDGAGGFVYISLNGAELFTASSTNYTCTSSGTLQFIIMGGGGKGSPGSSIGTAGNGGSSGSLNYGNIYVITGTSVQITVGGSNVASSIIVNGITYSAAGGNGGVAYGGGRGGGGGSAGTGHQGATYFNAAINNTLSLIGGGYFADNPEIFSTYSAFASGITTNMTNLTSATNSTYTINGSATNFSVEWIGNFIPPTTGSYTFYLNSDDASYLWIGSNAAGGYTTANANINNGGLHGMVNVSYTVTLTGGTLYPLRIQYGQKEGGYNLEFSFTGPGISLTYNMDGYVYIY